MAVFTEGKNNVMIFSPSVDVEISFIAFKVHIMYYTMVTPFTLTY